ncbi:MAG: hypothetical protein HC806_01715 [Anaerolineae bacterium]|nr:hypothetical protein [Anaerolineae bacterium]
MRKIFLTLFLVLLVGVAAFSMIQIVRSQESGDSRTLSSETQGENIREIQGSSLAEEPKQPDIGFIDSPSASCYQPDPTQNECRLTWYYLSVSASPNNMVTMTLTLNDIGRVAHIQGFFQTSMYVPYNMLGEGFKVPCGSIGAGGKPHLGNSYGYTIRARDSGGLSSANYGTAYCPAFIP